MVLYNLISHSTDEFKMKVVGKIKGELSSKLPASVPFFDIKSYNTIFPKSKSYNIKLINKALKYINTDEKYLQRFYRQHSSDIWYVNTIMLPEVISVASENKIPVILHVHELELMFVNLSGTQLKNIIDYPALIIATSNSYCRSAEILWTKK